MEIRKIEILTSDHKHKELSIGSGFVIIKDNKVLLVRGKTKKEFKFPGGHINDDESFQMAAHREAMEEIGVKVQIKSEPIFYLYEVSDELNIILVHYLADIIDGDPKPMTEIEEIRWVDINNIDVKVFDNVLKVLERLKLK